MLLRFDRLLSLLSVGMLLLVSLSGHAAGIDCAKATSATEKTICADKQLQALDYALASAWQTVKGFEPKSSQLQWLKLRDACGKDVACLSAHYNERLDVLYNAQFPVGTDQAGNRLETLRKESTNTDAWSCTADKRFCVRLPDEKLNELEIDDKENPPTYRFALPNRSNDQDSLPMPINEFDGGAGDRTLWSRVLRLAGDNDAILVGVKYSHSAGFSGGFIGTSALRLFKVSRNGAEVHIHWVLSAPIEGSSLSRACFSEEDMRDRLSVCHNECEFGATLGLDQTVKSGFPRLIYRTHTTRFPGTTRTKLRKQDLVVTVNPRCTYKRTLRFDTTTGVYIPDRKLPDCDFYSTESEL